jgi:hypothetical protein
MLQNCLYNNGLLDAACLAHYGDAMTHNDIQHEGIQHNDIQYNDMHR